MIVTYYGYVNAVIWTAWWGTDSDEVSEFDENLIKNALLLGESVLDIAQMYVKDRDFFKHLTDLIDEAKGRPLDTSEEAEDEGEDIDTEEASPT